LTDITLFNQRLERSFSVVNYLQAG